MHYTCISLDVDLETFTRKKHPASHSPDPEFETPSKKPPPV